MMDRRVEFAHLTVELIHLETIVARNETLPSLTLLGTIETDVERLLRPGCDEFVSMAQETALQASSY
jgi:hypothetical protein